MDHDVIVVGAGPAGLFASIFAASGGARVLLAERMPSCARKLLVSGAGQCNLTHEGSVQDFLPHYGRAESARFLKPSLYSFDAAALAEWFASRGLELEATEGGKVFPRSRKSRDVLSLLLEEARRAGVQVATGLRARSVRREAGGFAVSFDEDGAGSAGDGADRRDLPAARLVLATGGRSWPSTGSSGDGLALAASLGHRVTETAPALAPVIVDGGAAPPFAPFAACSGNALRDTTISVFRSGRRAAAGRGDVLLTHRGLSGPGILDLSRDIRPGDELRVALAPGASDDGREPLSEEEADRRLVGLAAARGDTALLRALKSFGLAESVARALALSLGLDAASRLATLPRGARRLLARSLAGGGEAGHPFRVSALGSWEEAMVTRGGVALEEVDPRSLGSRVCPGLFFAGEILDYDGDTGGYNIQAAFSTGRAAGLAAARPLGQDALSPGRQAPRGEGT